MNITKYYRHDYGFIIETNHLKYFGYSYLAFRPFSFSICEGGASVLILHWDFKQRYFYLRLRLPFTFLCFKLVHHFKGEIKKGNFISFYNSKNGLGHK